MPGLQPLNWCGNIAFRGSTSTLVDETLRKIIRENQIRYVIDVCLRPDQRLKKIERVEAYFFRVPEGHTASIFKIETIAAMIGKLAESSKVLIVSRDGFNRAPLLAVLAVGLEHEDAKRILADERYIRMPCFRSLVE